MEHLNLFVAQIAVIFLPGIIWARLDARYAAKEKRSDLDFFIAAFIFGVVAYAVTFVGYAIFKQPFSLIDFKEAQDKSVLTAQVGWEILVATAVGFMLAILWVYASTWKLLTRFLQFIRATKRYGDEDVWDFTFNSPDPSTQFVNVRDFEKKIVYTGRVNAFSESGKLRELTLFDVELYDFEGQFMYYATALSCAKTRRYSHRVPDFREATMTQDRKLAQDGYSNGLGPLTEGYLRKGGLNPPTSEAFHRPPPPAPMRAASPAPGASPKSSNQKR